MCVLCVDLTQQANVLKKYLWDYWRNLFTEWILDSIEEQSLHS